jgi:UDP-glucuronate 4-epimerase
MKILLTGVAGFIGYSLASRLLDEGRDFIGIDDMNDNYDPLLKKKRIEDLTTRHKNFKFQKLDINNRLKLDRLFKAEKFTHIINLAARAGIRNSLLIPEIYFQTNVMGVLNILELMRKYGIKNLVQASTSSAYGNNKSPFREDDNVSRPLSPYAASKISSEALCHSYHYYYGFDITIFRFFTVYGIFGRPDLSILRFIYWIDEGKPVEVFGNGMQKRDFTYVDDIVDGVIRGMKLKDYNIINLGNHRPVVLMDVIRILEQYLGKKAKLKFLPRNSADILSTCADIRRAGSLLGWKPLVPVEKGLKIIVDWYLANKEWMRKVKI